MEYNLYYNKYLKYKNKYLTLHHNIQHNIQHGGDKKYKILIVVDVQNCFLEHFGTFGWQPKDIEGESEEDKKIRREGYVKDFKEKLNTFLHLLTFKTPIFIDNFLISFFYYLSSLYILFFYYMNL